MGKPHNSSYWSKGSEGTACPLFYGSHVNLGLISEFFISEGLKGNQRLPVTCQNNTGI